jgi:hypothetical protein
MRTVLLLNAVPLLTDIVCLISFPCSILQLHRLMFSRYSLSKAGVFSSCTSNTFLSRSAICNMLYLMFSEGRLHSIME